MNSVGSLRIKAAVAGFGVVAGLALAGCAGPVRAGSAGSAGSAGLAGSAGSAPSFAPTPATTDRAAPPKALAAPAHPEKARAATSNVLPDGKSEAHLKKIDTTKRTVTFDLIVFLQDPERTKRWLRDNPGQTSGPDNDYLIQNDNPKLRTLPIASSARIRTLDFASDHGVSPTRVQTLGRLATSLRADGLPFTLTVKNGVIVGLTEIYLP